MSEEVGGVLGVDMPRAAVDGMRIAAGLVCLAIWQRSERGDGRRAFFLCFGAILVGLGAMVAASATRNWVAIFAGVVIVLLLVALLVYEEEEHGHEWKKAR